MYPENLSPSAVNEKINKANNPIIDVLPPSFKDGVYTGNVNDFISIPDFSGFNGFY
eukprot:gene12097-5590_t